MICTNCSKLAAISAQKECRKCKIKIFNNLDILCIKCSAEDNVCARCLKNMINKNSNSGCRSCGRNK